MSREIKPASPVPDHESESFWEGLRQGRVLLQECEDCQRHRFPPMPRCPYCRSVSATWQEISGSGQVYSWIVAQRAFAPEFAGDVPYTVATVDFDEGVRVALRIDDAAGIDFGSKVRTAIKHHDDWSELRVRLVQ